MQGRDDGDVEDAVSGRLNVLVLSPSGLPATTAAHAFVLGPPYTTLWAGGGGKETGVSLRLESVDHWREAGDVFDLIGGPPVELADTREVSQPAPGSFRFATVPVYPKVWPFGA